MNVLHVVGARPNFMKVAPVMAALAHHSHIKQLLVHTGQHYDKNMSQIFFHELGLPQPDINLEVASGSHAQQTAQIMQKFEPVLMSSLSDLVLVYGDVNSTLAAALVSAKLFIPIGHVEAGLRSFDRAMPEEINRLLTDQLSDFLFTPSPDGDANLLREGVTSDRIHLVGNVMIDTLVRLSPEIDSTLALANLKLAEFDSYALVTLHRPSNVDDPSALANIIATLEVISRDLLIIFPVHPRTRRNLEQRQTSNADSQLHFIEPLGYLDFLALQRQASLVITDSGGIQEETTYLGVPCLTLRSNTERPVTVNSGTNILVGNDMDRLRVEVEKILAGKAKSGEVPALWDGQAARRIADIIVSQS